MKCNLIDLQKKGKLLCTTLFNCFCIFVMCTTSSLSFAQESAKETELAALDAEIQLAIDKYKIPSVTFAIMSQGQPLHLRAYGMANKDADIKASITTQYRIASISKMIVSIAVMQLVESGELNLDDKIADILPDFTFSNRWSKTHPLQLAHILESTTGWDGISLKEFAYDNNPPLDLKASLAINPNSRESRWPPGTRHAYNNSAATVAALIVENITGMSFFSYAEQHIFRPLGVQSATYSDLDASSAIGYKNGAAVTHKTILFRPAGGLSLNIEDMAKLLGMFINRGMVTNNENETTHHGHALLSPQTISRMEHSHTTNVAEFSAGYGLFNSVRYYDGIRYRGHDGSLPGWLSELSYAPKLKAGFVVLQNSEQGQGFRAIVNLITAYLAKDFAPNKFDIADIPDEWADMSGYYRYQNPRFSKRFFIERLVSAYKLEITDDKAVFKSVFPPGWRREITYQSPNTWQNDKGEAVLKLGDDPILGRVLHWGDRVFVPISALNAWIDKVALVVWVLLLLAMFVHSIVWSIQHIKRKLAKVNNSASKPAAFRFSVSVANWSVLLFILVLVLGLSSPIERFGNVGVYSLGLFFSSLLMPIATLWAIWQWIVTRKVTIGKFTYRYCGLYLFVQLVVLVYLLNYGVVGILSWS